MSGGEQAAAAVARLFLAKNASRELPVKKSDIRAVKGASKLSARKLVEEADNLLQESLGLGILPIGSTTKIQKIKKKKIEQVHAGDSLLEEYVTGTIDCEGFVLEQRLGDSLEVFKDVLVPHEKSEEAREMGLVGTVLGLIYIKGGRIEEKTLFDILARFSGHSDAETLDIEKIVSKRLVKQMYLNRERVNQEEASSSFVYTVGPRAAALFFEDGLKDLIQTVIDAKGS
jgi:hypothetical protein